LERTRFSKWTLEPINWSDSMYAWLSETVERFKDPQYYTGLFPFYRILKRLLLNSHFARQLRNRGVLLKLVQALGVQLNAEWALEYT
jgi:hypothetical protein